MVLPLSLHLAIHLYLAILTGYLAGKYFKNILLGIIVGICGGFFIDLDHVLEYFLVFNWQFDLYNFLDGRQFLVSDKIHLWFHAWEYIFILLLLSWFFRNNKILKIILVTLSLAMSVHLLTDTIINKVPLKFYTIIYRANRGFEAINLMSADAYQENQNLRKELGI